MCCFGSGCGRRRLTVKGLENPASLCASSSQASPAAELAESAGFGAAGALTAGRPRGSTPLLPQSAHSSKQLSDRGELTSTGGRRSQQESRRVYLEEVWRRSFSWPRPSALHLQGPPSCRPPIRQNSITAGIDTHSV